MQPLSRTTSPEPWIVQLFASKAALKGEVVRRSRTWVNREVGREKFIQEVQRRGHHLIETGNQFIVVCHNGPIQILF